MPAENMLGRWGLVGQQAHTAWIDARLGAAVQLATLLHEVSAAGRLPWLLAHLLLLPHRATLSATPQTWQDADVLLLDDCLAAVDAKVAAWILRHALLGPLLWGPAEPSGAGEEPEEKHGRGAGKQQRKQQGGQQQEQQHQQPQPQQQRQRTVVVVTHSPELLAAADLVAELRGGSVAAVRQQPGAAQLRVQAAAEVAAPGTGEGSGGVEKEPLASGEQVAEGQHAQQQSEQAPQAPQQEQQAQQQAEEERQTGHVRWEVYRQYAAATGWGWVALILGSLLLMQVGWGVPRKGSRCGASVLWVVKLPLGTCRSCSPSLNGKACNFLGFIHPTQLPQATRNGNDLWLSHWVSHTPSAAPPAAVRYSQLWQQQRQPGLQRQKAEQLPGVPSAALTAQYAAPAAASWWCGASALPGVPLPAGALMGSTTCQSSWGSGGNSSHSRGGDSLPGSASGSRFKTSGSSHTRGKGGGSKGGRQPLDPTVRFYLTGLLVIAAVNSVITLIRAFSFAKGGLVAAQVCRAGGRVFTSKLCQRCWDLGISLLLRCAQPAAHNRRT